MDTSSVRRTGGSRLKPLASGLALALALGTGPLAASPAAIVDRLPIGELLPNGRPSGPPPGRMEWTAATAMRYPALHPVSLPIPDVPAGSLPVTNCDDSGPGSLRDAIGAATSGQTIDLTATGCSTISLTTGDISIGQQDLTLQGPGANYLTIDGSDLYSLRHHNDFGGTLTVNDLAIAHGRRYLDATLNLHARGGCLYSYGTISLANTLLEYCTAETANLHYYAEGGAVFAKAGLTAINSSIILSTAASSPAHGYGGGAFTLGPATIAYSSIGLNYASSAGGGIVATAGLFMNYSSLILNSSSSAGGLYAGGNTTIQNSTIASNSASTFGGGLIEGSGATLPLTLINSTVSGNSATQLVGGIAFARYPARIENSTIAFNTEANPADARYGAGLFVGVDVEFESSIIAMNTLSHSVYGPVGDDIGGSGNLTGANNLTQFVLAGLALPADTIYADARLSPLAYNGGITQTHALSPLSPAVDAGNNAAGLATDQRGVGFARVIGANADIGAFELNLDDVIFADDFED